MGKEEEWKSNILRGKVKSQGRSISRRPCMPHAYTGTPMPFPLSTLKKVLIFSWTKASQTKDSFPNFLAARASSYVLAVNMIYISSGLYTLPGKNISSSSPFFFSGWLWHGGEASWTNSIGAPNWWQNKWERTCIPDVVAPSSKSWENKHLTC